MMTTESDSPFDLTSILLRIALRAGDAVMRHYAGATSGDANSDAGASSHSSGSGAGAGGYHGEVAFKDDASPLTQADLASHEVIMHGLHESFPDIPVLSEEGEEDDATRDRSIWRRFFLVDPLDGTKEFISGNGEFTVNIALIDEGVPVAGVVVAPAIGKAYWGDRRSGSFRASISAGGEPQAVERIWSREYAIGEPCRVVVSRSHGDPDTIKLLASLGIAIDEEVAKGSSLKFCLVAEGSADLYPRLGPTMEWDTAAGDAVWRWSSIHVDTSGAPIAPRPSTLRYNKPTLKNGRFIIGLDADIAEETAQNGNA